MNSLDYKFEVLDPEYPDAVSPRPQLLVFEKSIDDVVVIIYFMANTALKINGGIAKSALGKVRLYYKASSPSGALCASVKLRKIRFTFKNSQGMARNFKFLGEKKSLNGDVR